jgi:hypothetical protein
MSSEAQVALIVGVVSAVAALVGAMGGTALGWWLNRKNERRSERRAAFVDLLTSMTRCHQVSRDLVTRIKIAASQQDIDRTALEVSDAMDRVDHAVNTALLAVRSRHLEVLAIAQKACHQEAQAASRGEESEAIKKATVAIVMLAWGELR